MAAASSVQIKKVGCDVTFLFSRGMHSENQFILVVFAYVEKAILSNTAHSCPLSVSSFESMEGFAGSAPLTILEEIVAEDKRFCEEVGIHYHGRWLQKIM